MRGRRRRRLRRSIGSLSQPSSTISSARRSNAEPSIDRRMRAIPISAQSKRSALHDGAGGPPDPLSPPLSPLVFLLSAPLLPRFRPTPAGSSSSFHSCMRSWAFPPFSQRWSLPTGSTTTIAASTGAFRSPPVDPAARWQRGSSSSSKQGGLSAAFDTLLPPQLTRNDFR